jgi:hypothetical protein
MQVDVQSLFAATRSNLYCDWRPAGLWEASHLCDPLVLFERYSCRRCVYRFVFVDHAPILVADQPSLLPQGDDDATGRVYRASRLDVQGARIVPMGPPRAPMSTVVTVHEDLYIAISINVYRARGCTLSTLSFDTYMTTGSRESLIYTPPYITTQSSKYDYTPITSRDIDGGGRAERVHCTASSSPFP